MQEVNKKVEELLEDDNSGHSYDHIFRVHDIATKLAKLEGANEEIVSLACLLHDCDDYKLYGEQYADELVNARAIMRSTNVSPEKQEAVCKIISSIGYSKSLSGIRPITIEGMVVSDADMLDAMGASGIVRCLVYSVSRGKSAYFDRNSLPKINISTEEYKQSSGKPGAFINHFFEKLLKLKGLILTESGKKEAVSRHTIMVEFLRHFFQEQNAPEWSKFLEERLEE